MNGTARIILFGLLGLGVSGCTASLAQCLRQDAATMSTKSAGFDLPDGCRITGDISGTVSTVSCDNGREGFAFSGAPDLPLQSPK